MSDSEYQEGEENRRGGAESGRETEDEMRKRILAELEEERKALENELKELKLKSEKKNLPGVSLHGLLVVAAAEFRSLG